MSSQKSKCHVRLTMFWTTSLGDFFATIVVANTSAIPDVVTINAFASNYLRDLVFCDDIFAVAKNPDCSSDKLVFLLLLSAHLLFEARRIPLPSRHQSRTLYISILQNSCSHIMSTCRRTFHSTYPASSYPLCRRCSRFCDHRTDQLKSSLMMLIILMMMIMGLQIQELRRLFFYY